jgi:tetratricopeptide (TPR) repeat protein
LWRRGRAGLCAAYLRKNLRDKHRVVALIFISFALAGQPLSDTLAEAHRLLRKDDVAAAAAMTAEAVAQAPGAAGVQELLGELHFRQGDVAGAEADFRAALERDASLARAWWGLGRVQDGQSLHYSAELSTRKANDLDPSDPDVVYAYAQLLKPRERVEALRRYLRLAANYAERWRLDDVRRELAFDEQVGDRALRRLASGYESAAIPLLAVPSLEGVRGWAMLATVNGGKPIKLLVDTGASGIILRAKAAKKSGIRKLADTVIRGVGDEGDRAGYSGVADGVRIGQVTFEDYPLDVADTKAFYDEDGLIGTDVFADFLVTLDFRKRELRLDPLPGGRPEAGRRYDRVSSGAMGGFTPVLRMNHCLLIGTTVNDAKQALFLLDTGAAVPIVSKSLEGPAKRGVREPVRVRGASGNVGEVSAARELQLQFAGIRQRQENAIVLDLRNLSKLVGVEVSGLLAWPSLRGFRVTLDYRDGLVRFE